MPYAHGRLLEWRGAAGRDGREVECNLWERWGEVKAEGGRPVSR